jgi:hypothetical protein
MKTSRLIAAFAAVALLGASRVALAQGKGAPSAADAPRPPPARPDTSAASRLDRPVRVRASHRVDVIGPGERVETVLDRMRTATRAPVQPGDVKPVDRPAPRPPDRAREQDNRGNGSSGDSQRGQGGPRPPPGNLGPASDRPHR